MAAPRALTNASTFITIDGIDMHLYGMVVHQVNNPIPQPVESSVSIPGRDGSFDFSRVLGSRTITIEGEIIADNHTTLLTYVDEINKIIRLRSDGRTYKLIFSDQSDRFWNVRISSSDMQFKGLRGFGKSIRFSLRLLSPKPFAEKTTMSTYYNRLSVNKHVAMYNIGNYKTPVNIKLKSIESHNIVEDVASYSEVHQCAWTEDENCSITYTSEGNIYGPSGTVVTQTNHALKSVVAIDIGSVLDKTRSFIISCFVTGYSVGAIKLLFEAGMQDFEHEISMPSENWRQLSIVVDKDLIADETVFALSLECAGGGMNDEFIVNGTCVYYLDDRYDEHIDDHWPIPYYIGSLAASNITLTMFNGMNVFPYKNGQPISSWMDSSHVLGVTKNPIDDGNCLCFHPINSSYVMSPDIPVQSTMVYRIRLKHCLYDFAGTEARASITWYCDDGIVIDDTITFMQLSAVSNSFTELSTTVTAPVGASTLNIVISSFNAAFTLYIKDIMVAYESETPPPYEPTNMFKQYYTGDIVQGSSLNIDNENGYCRMENAVAVANESVSNAMQYFSGDLFHIEPGYNFLSMEDARNGSTTPEEDSSGTLGILYSYRARYI